MPILKLRKHQPNFSEEDILINPSDFNGLQLNDVVELKPPRGGNSSNRILLQVRKWPEGNSYPSTVSIKDTVINNHLKTYADVLINIVDKRDVRVDSIEICFSNAYLARSYMWGLRNHLNNRCVYQRQKLDYLHIRSQICEIWAQGNKVTSGHVDDETKIVFRSASSLVYLFIQMSSEMWDYDINGDLYCEKAINGFLTELFDTWRRNDCSHDITIVLFSRTFYDAESIEEFPKEMRECLQVDHKNRFYEDCYRVAFQNDRFDLHDWNAKLTILKSLFNQYQSEVIDRHQEKYTTKIPRAYNSSASQGNFLEVLNMSLNVFEKHYFDRSFDRTGQLSVVVSPGVGVFEVDFEMTNLTKQRIIDNGIGSDLVCLGEQPLHTVPLLKFNSKTSAQNDNFATCDVYNMPHWINLSFYSSQNQVYYSNFIPRIKLPTLNSQVNLEMPRISSSDTIHNNRSNNHSRLDTETSSSSNNNSGHDISKERNNERHSSSHMNFSSNSAMPDLVDYDDYDAQVFKPNSAMTYNTQQASSRGERSILSDLDTNIDRLSDNDDDYHDREHRTKSANIERRSSDVKTYQEYSRSFKRQDASENLPINQSRLSSQIQSTFTRMSLVDSYLTDIKIKPESADDLSVRGYNVQSSRLNRSSTRPKALINPFDPSHMTIKLTPNRRRWTHVFPQGPAGTFIQQHHYQPVPQKTAAAASPYLADISPPTTIMDHEPIGCNNSNNNNRLSVARDPKHLSCALQLSQSDSLALSNKRLWFEQSSNLSAQSQPPSKAPNSSHNKSTLVSNDTIRFAWCASGEQEWTPALTTGVDWKSLTMPACLPLTTDFFPSKTSLQNDYVIGEYTIDSSCIHSRYSLIEVYRELVCQRLQKGFQIILLPRQNSSNTTSQHSSKSSSLHKSASSSRHRSGTAGGSRTSSGDSGEIERERTEYTMSIGRIFHKLSLNGNTITVTQYRPRHPYPTIKIDYCYRFRAPFHENYGQSWVHFKSEKLENYSWNYLDNYICARGESFELRTSLKFWRFRILILPSIISLRKIAANDDGNRHDILYPDFSSEEIISLTDSFLKLLEIINKTRRASASRMSSRTSHVSLPLVNGNKNQHLTEQQPVSMVQNSHGGCPSKLYVRIGSPHDLAGGGQREMCEDDGDNEDKDNLAAALKFEFMNMDIDSALRDAKRAEWVHVQYHNFYEVNQAFELVIKWMVASGAGIAEMVQGWSRKTGNSSRVHVVPIPWEPFAMPHSGKADPLRCPIGIRLHIDRLPGVNSLDDNQVIELQEKILRRYGFLRFHDLISSENIERQFVHLSGFAFVALPNIDASSDFTRADKDQSPRVTILAAAQKGDPTVSSSKNTSQSAIAPEVAAATKSITGQNFKDSERTQQKVVSLARLEHQETNSSPHEEYITRHISGVRQSKAPRLRGENEQIEFIWSWNYMLTKRWRSQSTQDESYAVSLMQDFKDFCQNDNNRLLDFWHELNNLPPST